MDKLLDSPLIPKAIIGINVVIVGLLLVVNIVREII